MSEADAFNHALSQGRGEIIANFYNVNFLINKKRELVAFSSDVIRRSVKLDVWNESLAAIFDLIHSESIEGGFKLYNNAIAPIIRSFKDLSTNLSVPVLKAIAKSLHYYAINDDYSAAASQMQKLLPLALSRKSADTGESALLYVIDELMTIYGMKNNFKQILYLMETVDSSTKGDIDYSEFPIQEVAMFNFLRGRVYAVYLNLFEAQRDLLFSLQHTPFTQHSNRRLIMLYLIPVQILAGLIPTQEIIQEYQLNIYTDLIKSIIECDINLFENYLSANCVLFFKLGIYDLIVKTKTILYLRLLKMCVHAYGDYKFPVVIFQQAIGSDNIIEAEAIMSNLIYEKKVKAYISHPHKMAVFHKAEPFPEIVFSPSEKSQ